MTLAELFVVLAASPVVFILLYGSWRFHTDPDGDTSISVKIPTKLKRSQATRVTANTVADAA